MSNLSINKQFYTDTELIKVHKNLFSQVTYIMATLDRAIQCKD